MNQTSAFKIAIAAVLKPIDDIRLYHKIGKTLLEHLPVSELHVLAYYPLHQALPSSPSQEKVFFYRLFGRGRLHFSRLWVNVRLMYQLARLRPQCLIIGTWELIPAAIFLHFFYGTAIVYDVQENYVANLLHTQVYPKYLGAILARFVAALERLLLFCKPLFLFAEQCYISQKPKLRPYLLLENKCLHTEVKHLIAQTKGSKPQKEAIQLLYCGTISADYGIFDLLDWIEVLRAQGEIFELKIVGFAPSSKVQTHIKIWAKDKSHIFLQGIDAPLAHSEIMQAIYEADAVLMPYQVNQSYAARIPTKFFECLALNKPMCISPNPFWEDYLNDYSAARACFIDFRKIEEVSSHWQKIKQNLALQQLSDDPKTNKDIFWEAQVPKLIEQFNKIIAC